ncbi:splicing factor, Prp19-binding domain-containing protein [Desarmillaria tabescens]|uniref:Splicing factor, Prp19-binding domain-containing protein n=1 Tax=Armillaria tabescens TaxID=1929756 RepID=A0AA39MTD2_ARMTA|nr:splicing factor, Prp19-binding domain-containing protein [Desarmillaria tabescens]KAK0446416.1 splicing factor, Prp19-binding domain-containing protein [Desarmillaria tabescens]
MSSAPRKQAPRLARPAARYWKGKAPKGVAEVDSESDEEAPEVEEEGDVLIGGEQDIVQEDDEDLPTAQNVPKARIKSMNVALKDVNISKDGKVIVAGRDESGRTALEDEEESEEEESEEDTKPGQLKEESDEDEKPKLQLRPVFVPKRNRVTIAEKEALAADSEEVLRKKELELEERKKQSHDLVAESIRRELAEKEKEDDIPDVDDTDGLDPPGEFEAWRLRELGRIKKEKEEEIRREEERAEVERRRALPEAQRLKEDLEHAQKLRDEKPKGQQKFLQKYWHKGAFHQDEEILKRHDYTEATTSTVDVSSLPKVMQVKNFGKRSRTKYTHLLDQDTTVPTGGFGGNAPVQAGGKSLEGGGCFLCGGPHLKKDCPQNTGPLPLSGRGPGTGSNNVSGGSRTWGAPPPPRDGQSWRSHDDVRDDNDGRSRDRGLRREDDGYHRHDRSKPGDRYDYDSRGSRRRSRSPRRSPDGYDDDRDYRYRERRRSRERLDDRDHRDKRRRTIAIIGSGLAGLTAAYLLTKHSQDGDICFDTSTLGMDSSSISLPLPGQDQDWRVDVPMRSFQGGYYKQLMALYKRLGVKFTPRNFSYSFSLLSMSEKGRQITAEMIYNGSSGLGGVSMPSTLDESKPDLGLALQAASKAWTIGLFVIWSIHILLCYLRLLWLSIPMVRSSEVETMTYKDWVKKTHPTSLLAKWTGFEEVWTEFTHTIMVPLFSAVCTAPEQEILDHPVEEFLDYIWLTLGTHHYVVVDGVRDVVGRLVSTVRNVHLSHLISSIEADPDNPDLVSVNCTNADGAKTYTGFHHIIFATQANRAVPLLSSYASSLTGKRREAVEEQMHCLEKFTYHSTLVINHTDETLLPDDTRDHRDLNLIYTRADTLIPPKTVSSRCLPSSYTMATHVLPRPPGFPAHLPAVFQSTDPIIEPREGRILSVARLERAVVTLESKQALKELYHVEGRTRWRGPREESLGRLQGAGRLRDGSPGIWMCGSFAYPGIPLLEGCVVSARLVVEQGLYKSEGVRVKHPPW